MLLTEEQLRVLRNRILAALETARYYPAIHLAAGGDEHAVEHILRFPFTPEEHNSGKRKD